MKQSGKNSVGRRNFLKITAGSAAALVTGFPAAKAQQSSPPISDPSKEMPNDVEVLTTDRPGSDFMVDVIKLLGFDYVCSNPASAFRSLQESLVNYGGNRNPEFITCCHEESSVAMGHGYFKVEGKPIIAMMHATVGLQHASMAVYNAFCDRVPVYLILGNILNATERAPGVEWYHAVQDAAAMVRDYTKWDDNPISLPHFAESAVRAYKIAMTPVMEPVVLVADAELQEKPMVPNAKIPIPKLTLTSPPAGDPGAVEEVARLLVAAENPVIVADRVARTADGMRYLVELAETLQAAIADTGGRMNFPSRHPLNQWSGGPIGTADVILGLETSSLWGTVNSMSDRLYRTTRSRTKAGVKLITITATDLYTKSNYQDFQRYQEVDIAIAADAEATLPSLIEAVRKLITADHRRRFQDRGAKLAAAAQRSRQQARERATWGWDASPISPARLTAELWAQIKTKDWALVSRKDSLRNWPTQLWDFNKYHHHIGGTGGAGIGYNAPAAVGAALAHRKHGRLCINLQNDGDLMYAPGVLWTAAHHRIPMLTIMFNNRAYHQEFMYLQQMANHHNRNVTTAHIGTTLDDPNIDFAKMAQSMGWYSEGPITDPEDLALAIHRAVAVVERGEPALLDVVMQPR